MEEKILDYIDQHKIKFELRAIDGDGEVLAKYSSGVSADDVAGYAGLLDNAIDELVLPVINSLVDEVQYKVEADAEAQMQDRLDRSFA